MRTLADLELKRKKVLLRTDLNLPVEDGDPRETVRFRRYVETIEGLSEAGARTVVMAHQGRPARKDFLSLEKHAEMLSISLDQPVDFLPGFFGPSVRESVESLKKGEVAVMENVRFLSEELQNVSAERHAEDFFVRELSELFDVFVNDAFSAAHRSHGSLTGFSARMESAAGPIMRRELEACGRVRDEIENPVLVLGGEKPSDIVGMLEQMAESANKILLGGVPGEVALVAEGNDLGPKEEWMEDRGLLSEMKKLSELIEQHREKFLLPEDVRTGGGVSSPAGVEDRKPWDIGPATAEKYVSEVMDAQAVLMKGPVGAFEDHPEGTRKVLEAVADTDAYSVIGGGHTSSLVDRFGMSMDSFDHVSIAGGAFVRFMSGEKLPAVEALRQ